MEPPHNLHYYIQFCNPQTPLDPSANESESFQLRIKGRDHIFLQSSILPRPTDIFVSTKRLRDFIIDLE